MSPRIAAYLKSCYQWREGVRAILRRHCPSPADCGLSNEPTLTRPAVGVTNRTPRLRQETPAPMPKEVSGAPPTTRRILLVEHDAMARRSYGRALVGLGYAVDGVENGERAWQALRNGSYALLITENRLPKLSGWQLVQRLRGEGMGLPVILASGRIDLLEGEGSELCDIAVVLEKPFELPDLVDAVQYALHSDHGWRNGTRRYVATLADASSNWMKP